eukprot:4270339-Pleurochrysis_carterae.AAC.1
MAVDLDIAGHHHRARLSQPGARPLPDLCALLSHQAADPPPQGAAQGRRRQDDKHREEAAPRPGQDARQGGLRDAEPCP